MPVFIFFVAHWYLSLFFQTFFQHRYAAHQAFTMSKTWERIFFIGTFIFQGSSYLSTRAYAIMHRIHHAYTDTEDDPHSPSYSPNVFSMMWGTWKFYSAVYNKTADIDPKFTKNVPDWPVFDKIAGSILPRIGWVVVYILFYVKYAAAPWMFALIPIHVVMSPVHGAIINWFAHKYGYKNFEQKNTSENLLHVDFLMLGESYHNNHHKNPSSINFGVKWHEVDPIYPIILLFNKMGIIHVPKAAKNTLNTQRKALRVEEQEMEEVS